MRVNSKPKKEVIPPTSKPTIHNVFILDASGSMQGSKYQAAKNGIILETDMLKSDPNANYTNTLVEFGSHSSIQTRYFMTPIGELPPKIIWSEGTLGMTALYDALGLTINNLLILVKPDEKVLIKIFTDGEENNSTRFNAYTLKSIIKEVEAKGFTVTFEGTDFDTKQVIRNLGISGSNTNVHDNTTDGITRSAFLRVQATSSYAKAVVKGEDVTFNFYSKSVE